MDPRTVLKAFNVHDARLAEDLDGVLMDAGVNGDEVEFMIRGNNNSAYNERVIEKE